MFNKKFIKLLLIPILCLLAVISCKSVHKDSDKEIKDYIFYHTNINLISPFQIVKDTVIHSPTAFDSDFQSYLTIEYPDTNEQKLLSQIYITPFLSDSCYVMEGCDILQGDCYGEGCLENWSELKRRKLKGYWCRNYKGFSFIYICYSNFNPDVIKFRIDTINNIINFDHIHL